LKLSISFHHESAKISFHYIISKPSVHRPQAQDLGQSRHSLIPRLCHGLEEELEKLMMLTQLDMSRELGP